MNPAQAAKIGLFLAALAAAHAYAQQRTPAWSGSWLGAGVTHTADAAHAVAQHGVSLEAAIVQDLSRSVASNPVSQPWFSRYSWDCTARIDGERAAGWKGSMAALHLKQHRSAYGSVYSQPMQGYSNIDAGAYWGLYEAWAQQELWNGRLRIKAGKVDANTDFATVPTAADFLNSSMGYSPTLMEFPTYPSPRAGFEVFVGSSAWQAGLARFATASGTFSLMEGVHAHGSGRAVLGFWKLHERLTRFDGFEAGGTQGFYAVAEQVLWQPAAAAAGGPGGASTAGRRLSAFLQAGDGEGSVNPCTLHLGGGVVLTAPLLSRSSDALGVAASWVRLTGAPRAGYDAGGENVFEVYYRAAFGRGLSLISDLQYFRHPGGVRASRDVLIATPRIVFTF